ncbi:unnamed protein product [Fusarium graminearum]|nr:unnamed protein product [Fusarium graminearum]VTO87352.1 unnamed protein product [Fusarium graminearum]
MTQQGWCSPWKQDSEPLMLGRFGSSVIYLCLSKAIDIWNEGPSAFKYDLDPYTMYTLLPSQHLPSWNRHHLPVEDLVLPDVIYDQGCGIPSQSISLVSDCAPS